MRPYILSDRIFMQPDEVKHVFAGGDFTQEVVKLTAGTFRALRGRELGDDTWAVINRAFNEIDLQPLSHRVARKAPILFQLYRCLAEAGISQDEILVVMPVVDAFLSEVLRIFEKISVLREEIVEQVLRQIIECDEEFAEARSARDRDEQNKLVLMKRKLNFDLDVARNGAATAVLKMFLGSDYLTLDLDVSSQRPIFGTERALISDEISMIRGDVAREAAIKAIEGCNDLTVEQIRRHADEQEVKAKNGEADTLLRLMMDYKSRVYDCMGEGFDVLQEFIERELKPLFSEDDWQIVKKYQPSGFERRVFEGKKVMMSEQLSWIYAALKLVNEKNRTSARRALARVFGSTLAFIDASWASISRSQRDKLPGDTGVCRAVVDKHFEKRNKPKEQPMYLREDVQAPELLEGLYSLVDDSRMQVFLKALEPVNFVSVSTLDGAQSFWALAVLMSFNEDKENRLIACRFLARIFNLNHQVFQMYCVAIDGGRKGGSQLSTLGGQVEQLKRLMPEVPGELQGQQTWQGDLFGKKDGIAVLDGGVISFGDLDPGVFRTLVEGGVRPGRIQVLDNGCVNGGDAFRLFSGIAGVRRGDIDPESSVPTSLLVGKISPLDSEKLRGIRLADQAALALDAEGFGDPGMLFGGIKRAVLNGEDRVNAWTTALAGYQFNGACAMPVLATAGIYGERRKEAERFPALGRLGLFERVWFAVSTFIQEIEETIVSAKEDTVSRAKIVRQLSFDRVFAFAMAACFDMSFLRTAAFSKDGRVRADMQKPRVCYEQHLRAVQFVLNGAADMAKRRLVTRGTQPFFRFFEDGASGKFSYRSTSADMSISLGEILATRNLPQLDHQAEVLKRMGVVDQGVE